MIEAAAAPLDQTLLALADPTRRAILRRLGEGERRVTELAAPFPMSLNAVSKHIRMLERAGLVARRRQGREHLLSINPAGLDEAADWITAQRAMWTGTLQRLDALLTAEDAQPEETPMTAKPTVPLIVVHRFTASAERVFDAWFDPERARKFLFATPTGRIVRCEIDARVGGAFVITDQRDGQDIEHVGRFLEIDRPRRLSFTFSVPAYDADADPEATPVIIDIRPLDDGGCELTLTHHVWAEYLDQSRGGWALILEGLEAKAL